jgi:hypothetical protein
VVDPCRGHRGPVRDCHGGCGQPLQRKAYAHRYVDSCTDCHFDLYAHMDPHRNADSHIDCHLDLYAYVDPHPYGHADAGLLNPAPMRWQPAPLRPRLVGGSTARALRTRPCSPRTS